MNIFWVDKLFNISIIFVVLINITVALFFFYHNKPLYKRSQTVRKLIFYVTRRNNFRDKYFPKTW